MATRREGGGAGRQLNIPIVWVGTEETPVAFANAFFIQFVQPDQDEFVLTMGTVVPPALLGTPEQVAEQASQVSFVPVKAFARIGLTRQRVVELGQILETILRQYDAARRGSR